MKLKGSILEVVRSFTRKDKQLEDRIKSKLTDEEVKLLDSALAVSWLDVDIMGVFLDKVAKEIFPDNPFPMRALGKSEAKIQQSIKFDDWLGEHIHMNYSPMSTEEVFTWCKEEAMLLNTAHPCHEEGNGVLQMTVYAAEDYLREWVYKRLPNS